MQYNTVVFVHNLLSAVTSPYRFLSLSAADI